MVVHEGSARWQVESGQVLLSFDKPRRRARDEAPLVDAAARGRRRSTGRATLVPADRRGDLRARLRHRRGRSGAAPRRATARSDRRRRSTPTRTSTWAASCTSAATWRRPRRTTGAPWSSGRTTPTALFNLGVVLEDQGRNTPTALEAYARAIEADGRNADAHYNAARLYDLAGDYSAALRHLRICRDLTRTPALERRPGRGLRRAWRRG